MAEVSLNNLKPAKGARRKRKRIGRGPGSGHGKRATKGDKGQNARSGSTRHRAFEGGQMPLIRRIPKRGFTNIFRTEYQLVNIHGLEGKFEKGAVIDPEALYKVGLVRKKRGKIKLLANGELSKSLTVKVHKFSNSARDKVAKAGGTCEVIGS